MVYFSWCGLFFVLLLVSISMINYSFGDDYGKSTISIPFSPRQQILMGVLPENVTCVYGFVLIKKILENSVACVRQDTADRLLTRGWNMINSQMQNQQFITRESAITILQKKYDTLVSFNPSEIYFAFMKYNGTTNTLPQFMIYIKEQHSGLSKEWDNIIVFDQSSHGYLADKIVDRYAWIVVYSQGGGPVNLEYFVDAQTGKMIGIYNTCPSCSG